MKNTFRHLLKQYLNISKKDRNGITILSILIVLVIIINISVGFIKTNSKNDFSEFEKALLEWEQNQESESKNFQLLFTFNPNTISEQSLDSLLIPDLIKRNLMGYRKAGGKIRSVSDFKKIYGMNDSIFESIKNYIVIEVSSKNIESDSVYFQNYYSSNLQKKTDLKDIDSEITKVELNSADSTTLVKLRGVGPVFASRIIKYRNLLGGFYSTKQLLEVYNFPEETFNSIKSNIKVDLNGIKKIRLNFFDFSELLRHPYLNKEQVQAIINYRDKNGMFQSGIELTEQNILDSLTFQKIEPYLDCR